MAVTKENAKDFLPFIKALSEGKKIEYKDKDSKNEWEVVEKLFFSDDPSRFRIKPETKCRPFKSQKECWSEMHKHPDFGWVKNKQWGYYASLGCVGDNIIRSEDECHRDSFDYMYDNYTFTDGEPFGIKEEE